MPGRRIEKNPASSPAVAKASAVWRLFHKKDHPRKLIDVNIPWPAEWEYAGEAVTTYYSSAKWQADDKFTRYYHDHEGGKIHIWHPAGMFPWTKATPKPPRFAPPTAAAVLGFSLGVDVKRHDSDKSIYVGVEKDSYLIASPDRRRLWVVEPSKGITAMIAGPGLVVEARGIVG